MKCGVSPKGATDATTDAGGHSGTSQFFWENIKFREGEKVTWEKWAWVTMKFHEPEGIHVMTNKGSKCWVRREDAPKD
jgi:hypothetical protein